MLTCLANGTIISVTDGCRFVHYGDRKSISSDPGEKKKGKAGCSCCNVF